MDQIFNEGESHLDKMNLLNVNNHKSHGGKKKGKKGKAHKKERPNFFEATGLK